MKRKTKIILWSTIGGLLAFLFSAGIVVSIVEAVKNIGNIITPSPNPPRVQIDEDKLQQYISTKQVLVKHNLNYIKDGNIETETIYYNGYVNAYQLFAPRFNIKFGKTINDIYYPYLPLQQNDIFFSTIENSVHKTLDEIQWVPFILDEESLNQIYYNMIPAGDNWCIVMGVFGYIATVKNVEFNGQYDDILHNSYISQKYLSSIYLKNDTVEYYFSLVDDNLIDFYFDYLYINDYILINGQNNYAFYPSLINVTINNYDLTNSIQLGSCLFFTISLNTVYFLVQNINGDLVFAL